MLQQQGCDFHASAGKPGPTKLHQGWKNSGSFERHHQEIPMKKYGRNTATTLYCILQFFFRIIQIYTISPLKYLSTKVSCGVFKIFSISFGFGMYPLGALPYVKLNATDFLTQTHRLVQILLDHQILSDCLGSAEYNEGGSKAWEGGDFSMLTRWHVFTYGVMMAHVNILVDIIFLLLWKQFEGHDMMHIYYICIYDILFHLWAPNLRDIWSFRSPGCTGIIVLDSDYKIPHNPNYSSF